MPHKYSEATKFISQAKFFIPGLVRDEEENVEKYKRSSNATETNICCSNKHGLIFVGYESYFHIFVHSGAKLESKFDGAEEEQEMDVDTVLRSFTVDGNVVSVNLSTDESFLAVATTSSFHIVHMSLFHRVTAGPRTDLAPWLQPAQHSGKSKYDIDSNSANFSIAWNCSSSETAAQCLVVSGNSLQIICPIKGLVASTIVSGLGTACWKSDAPDVVLLSLGDNKLRLVQVSSSTTSSTQTLVETEIFDDLKDKGVHIHHLHWIEPSLVVVGYLLREENFEPSLALVHVISGGEGGTPAIKVLVDMEERVCAYDDDFVSSPSSHRFLSCYIKPWCVKEILALLEEIEENIGLSCFFFLLSFIGLFSYLLGYCLEYSLLIIDCSYFILFSSFFAIRMNSIHL